MYKYEDYEEYLELVETHLAMLKSELISLKAALRHGKFESANNSVRGMIEIIDYTESTGIKTPQETLLEALSAIEYKTESEFGTLRPVYR